MLVQRSLQADGIARWWCTGTVKAWEVPRASGPRLDTFWQVLLGNADGILKLFAVLIYKKGNWTSNLRFRRDSILSEDPLGQDGPFGLRIRQRWCVETEKETSLGTQTIEDLLLGPTWGIQFVLSTDARKMKISMAPMKHYSGRDRTESHSSHPWNSSLEDRYAEQERSPGIEITLIIACLWAFKKRVFLWW